MDRVKESIFNVLGDQIIGANVLDLFAGSGSLGIEALSREAEKVYFVDKSNSSINLIKKNLLFFNKFSDIIAKYKIIKSDATKFISEFDDFIWDIIFLDPPFKIESLYMKKIFDILYNSKIINENSVIIYEFFFKRDFECEIGSFTVIKTSSFGEKKVIYLAKKQEGLI